MKKLFLTITLGIMLFTPVSTLAASPGSLAKTDRKLADLNNRFSSIEANWGRFQMGGFFSLQTRSKAQSDPLNVGNLEFDQDLNLYFDAFIDQSHQLSLKLAHQGGWGYPTTTNNGSPMNTPLWIDEAFLRMKYPNSTNYLGRFKYSLGTFGLISDFLTYPVEGLVVQKEYKPFHLIGLYSRVNTPYQLESGQIVSGEDYLAARIGWSEAGQVFGVNLVPNGIVGERNFSLDWSLTSKDQKAAVELAWYSFNSETKQVDWTPGLLLSFERLANTDHYQVKLGYFTPEFTPIFSSLAYVADDNREWFLPNTKGVEFLAQNKLTNLLSLDNRLIVLLPVESTQPTDPGYHWRGALVSNYSPFNHLQVGIESWYTPEYKANQLFLSWDLQF